MAGKVILENLLTVKEVAERLRVSRQTVGRMIKDGRLAYMNVGRLVRIRKKDLQSLIESLPDYP